MRNEIERVQETFRLTRERIKAKWVAATRPPIDLVTFVLKLIKSLSNTPWSVRSIVRNDIADWRSFNRYQRSQGLSPWMRSLTHAGEHPIWLCLSGPVAICVLRVLVHYLPASMHPASWKNWPNSDRLTYFTTLWSVQATIAALAFPMVIAFVAVFLQRRPAADNAMHLYMLNSGALPAGLSSLMLVVAMGVQYVAVPHQGSSSLLPWGALDAIWFTINALLTAHFLYRTVEFLRADVQLDVVRRHVVSVALPRDVARLWSFQVFAQAHSRGWISTPDHLDEKSTEGPRVHLTRYLLGRGTQQGTIELRSESRLTNVRLWPLVVVIALWARAASKWPRPAAQQFQRRAVWPTLSVPMTPGSRYHETLPLALVEAGPDLDEVLRSLLRRAFSFTSVKRERFEIQVASVLEEFELDARTAVSKPNVKEFERAYETLVGLHRLLLGASLFESSDGTVTSWALMPDLEHVFQRSLYENWNNTYRHLFLAAIESMATDASPVRRLCHIVRHLGGRELRESPAEIREGMLDLPLLLMYQLGDWWARQVEEQGAGRHGAHQMVTLIPPLFHVYENVISTFVGGWENAKDDVAEMPASSDTFEWTSAYKIAKLRAAHVQGTSKLLIAAVMRGDQTAAEWFADALGKWWGDSTYEHQPFMLVGKTDFFTVDDLEANWQEIEASFGLTDENSFPTGIRQTEVQRGVLRAALLNLWTDIRLVTVELLISLACQHDQQDLNGSLAIEIATGLLNGKQWRTGGTASESLRDMTATEYLTAKVRQFASGGHYRTGYVSRLDTFVERIKNTQQPGMISSRVYSSFGADDLESLQEQQLILLAVLSDKTWQLTASLSNQIDVWMTRQYRSIEIVRSRLDAWLRRLSDTTELLAPVVDTLLNRTGKPQDAPLARSNLHTSLEAIKATVENRRNEVLHDEAVDPERLEQIAMFASRSAFSTQSGPFPLQLFEQNFRDSDAPLEDFNLTVRQIRKGEMTKVEMDQRAINESDFWDDAVRNNVGQLIMWDVLRACDAGAQLVPDAELYWAAVQSFAESMTAQGLHPILLLENPTKPDWVWEWQHAYIGLGYQKPQDLRVWHANDKGHAYICNFNDVEVYGVFLQPGQSILLTREAFDEISFQRYAEGRYVDTSYTARSDSDSLIDIHLKFSRQVAIGTVDALRLVYAQEEKAP
ncbi:hypothetical protein [Paraburkholderia domus]|uniref:hypothetical protein n=1 Tax=Paraburkholderia domus TaxID=2793075 RepID=UPI001B1419D8|nr:hypothetical protein [Paraburkholderia domus]CAE6696023.1 hypothetical protein R75483_00595 [Paraburkholderia domus]